MKTARDALEPTPLNPELSRFLRMEGRWAGLILNFRTTDIGSAFPKCHGAIDATTHTHAGYSVSLQ